MITRLRAAAIGIALTAPVVTAAANPSWTTTLGFDVWNLPELQEEARAAAETGEALKAAQDEVRGRIDTKEELIRDLVAGRRSLDDVATQFTVLNEGYDDLLAMIRHLYPGATDEEKTLWNVVDFARFRTARLPTWQRLAIMTRLHGELLVRSAQLAATPSN